MQIVSNINWAVASAKPRLTMFKLCVVVALAAVAAAHYVPADTDKVVADKDFLTKEKAILHLLYHVQQPLFNPELIEIANNFNLLEHKDMFMDEKVVMKFWKKWESQLFLKRGEEFSPLDWEHREMASNLIDLFTNAKDWDTFYKTAVKARQYVNEGLFLFSLTVAINTRADTQNLILPAMYEILPHMFIRSEVMQKAYDLRMKSSDKTDKDVITIPSNFSQWLHTKMDSETRMIYYTEDLALNAWNWDLQTKMDMMAWKGVDKDYEMVRYMTWMWILSRYNLERMSNNLPGLKKFTLTEELPGFAPHLRLKNGKEIPMRPTHMKLTNTVDVDVESIRDIEHILRFYDANMLVTEKKVMMESYITLFKKLLNLAGRVADPMKEFDMAPGALMFYETQLRDPLYYRILERIHDIKKDKWTFHEKNDLKLDSVKIDSLETDKLITFYETFDVELNNGLDVNGVEDDKKMTVVAKHSRINHKPFNYRVVVDSKEDMKAKVQVFLMPKRDVSGLEMTWVEKMPYTVEIDEFFMDLTAGKNKMERSSLDFPFFKEDKDSFRTLYKKVEDALQGKAPFYIKETKDKIRYPANLILPKGKKNGMSYSMIVLVTKVNKNDVLATDKIFDFPFEGEMEIFDFMMPNIFEKEVIIYHKKTDETHESI